MFGLLKRNGGVYVVVIKDTKTDANANYHKQIKPDILFISIVTKATMLLI